MSVKPSSKVIAKNTKAPSKAKALGAAPVTSVSMRQGKTERSVEVRQIENGFIVRESTYGPKGYKSTERFTDKAPKIEVASLKAKK